MPFSTTPALTRTVSAPSKEAGHAPVAPFVSRARATPGRLSGSPLASSAGPISR